MPEPRQPAARLPVPHALLAVRAARPARELPDDRSAAATSSRATTRPPATTRRRPSRRMSAIAHIDVTPGPARDARLGPGARSPHDGGRVEHAADAAIAAVGGPRQPRTSTAAQIASDRPELETPATRRRPPDRSQRPVDACWPARGRRLGRARLPAGGSGTRTRWSPPRSIERRTTSRADLRVAELLRGAGSAGGSDSLTVG